MKIKVGEYVRTKDGVIAKLERIEEEYYFDNYIYREFEDDINYLDVEQLPEYITKHSPNIIELIEIGDYVNGHKVRCFKKENCDYDIGLDYNDDYGEYFGIDAEDIKTIVTKEQFKEMEYEV